MLRTQKLVVKLSKYYQLDTRALALMRVALALLVLIDLVIRGNDLLTFYDTNGLWPSKFVYAFSGKPGMWSLCTLINNNSWIIFLYSLNLLFAFTFLIGYKTKLSNLFLWILTLSFHNRNIYILQAGDDLLRLLLFCGLFLPWHLNLAVDKKSRSNLWNDLVGNLAYLCLISSVYFFSANLKSSAEWREEGSALYYVLSLDVFKTDLGNWVYQIPWLMTALTRLTLIIEYLIPLLILFPSKKVKLRFIAFVLICIMHLAFGLFLNVGLFYLISIVAGIGLLPANLMDKLIQMKKGVVVTKKNVSQKTINIFRNSFLTSCIALCLLINLSSLPWFNYQLKKEWMFVVNFLRIDQYWGMFSPSIPKQNTWLVYQAYNAKGQQYDIQNNEEYVDFKKPKDINLMFKSDRWRKLTENLQYNQYTFLRPLFCKFILKNWNIEHPENKMSTLNLYSVEETVLTDYKKQPPTKKILCVCDEH